MERVDRIEIRGLQLLAYCGVLPHEQEQKQPLEIDVDLYVDLEQAGTSDELSDTVNYGEVIDAISELTDIRRFALLEKVAADVVDLLSKQPLVRAATVSIHKVRPPVEAHVVSTGVRMHRTFTSS